MTRASLTPQEYEQDLKVLREGLRLYLRGGGGEAKQLLRDAESLMELSKAFPEVYQRNSDVEGLVAELLARRQQEKFLPPPPSRSQTPGCLLGWLVGRGRKPSDEP